MDRDHNAAKKIIQQLPVVHREFTPAEMTALLLLQFGAAVTSIETSNRLNEQV